MAGSEESGTDLPRGSTAGASTGGAADAITNDSAEGSMDRQHTSQETELNAQAPARPLPGGTHTALNNLAATAGAACAESSPPQQNQNDVGSVEHQRAMELLRSVDDEGSGLVIVCSANDGDDEERRSLTATSVAHGRPLSAATDIRHSTGCRPFSSVGDAEGTQPARFSGSAAAKHAVSGFEAERSERAGTIEVAGAQALAKDDPYIAQLTMQALDREREDMLKELEAYPALDFVRREYDKLHHQLKIAQKNELELKAKCLEMSAAMATNATQVHAALQEAGNEEETIKHLKRDLSACLIEVANGKAREAAETKAANQLRHQIEELYKRIDEEEGRAMQQTARLNELLQERDKLQSRKHSPLTPGLYHCGRQVSVFFAVSDVAGLQDLYTTQEQLQDRRAAADEEAKKRERVERQLKQNRAHLEQQQQELARKQAELAQSEEQAI
ncbi:hypothetical protein Efla_002067 [Eimeria flavescens]